MSDIKISNELLSWVLGDKCVFISTKGYKISFNHLGFTFNIDKYKTILNNDKFCEINIHEFIHLAKVNAFESKYFMNQSSRYVHVLYESKPNDYETKEFNKYYLSKTPFDIREMIDCLEWVAEEIGEKNE